MPGTQMRVLVFLIFAGLALDWIAFQGDYSSAVWNEAKREGYLLANWIRGSQGCIEFPTIGRGRHKNGFDKALAWEARFPAASKPQQRPLVLAGDRK
jgi:hypothetical protein